MSKTFRTESSANPARPGKSTRMGMRVRIGRVVGSIALCALCWAVTALIQGEQTQVFGRTPVVVELFTSEGCSSCPPADELLAKLDKTQLIAGVEIIPLEFHVDYWNELGWTDPFSSSLFSERQNSYARAFGNGRIYTPQMVVDGGAEFVGSNSGRAYEAIRRAARRTKSDYSPDALSGRGGGDQAFRIFTHSDTGSCFSCERGYS